MGMLRICLLSQELGPRRWERRRLLGSVPLQLRPETNTTGSVIIQSGFSSPLRLTSTVLICGFILYDPARFCPESIASLPPSLSRPQSPSRLLVICLWNLLGHALFLTQPLLPSLNTLRVIRPPCHHQNQTRNVFVLPLIPS